MRLRTVWTITLAVSSLPFTQDGSGPRPTLPSPRPHDAIAFALKLTKSGTAPAGGN